MAFGTGSCRFSSVRTTMQSRSTYRATTDARGSTRTRVLSSTQSGPARTLCSWRSRSGALPRRSCAHDVPEAALRDAPHPREEAGAALEQPCRFHAWPHIPIRVLAGADDRFFPLSVQRGVARARLDAQVHAVRGGHLRCARPAKRPSRRRSRSVRGKQSSWCISALRPRRLSDSRALTSTRGPSSSCESPKIDVTSTACALSNPASPTTLP